MITIEIHGDYRWHSRFDNPIPTYNTLPYPSFDVEINAELSSCEDIVELKLITSILAQS